MNKQKLIFVLVAIVVCISILYGSYVWFFCRFYVPAGHMAIVTSKTGDTPAVGTILVERHEKGIWRDVLTEGRHFLNPITHEIQIVPTLTIPIGKVGIVTAKIGKELPAGQIIADSKEFKGVWRDALGPGTYRLNPQGYTVEIVNAVNIPVGYVGVVTSQTGMEVAKDKFATKSEKGVLKDILQPGLYYINRYAYQVNIFEVGMNQVTMSGVDNTSIMQSRNTLQNFNTALVDMEKETLLEQKSNRQNLMKASNSLDNFADIVRSDLSSQKKESLEIFGLSRAVEFPSRDGFKVMLDMTVEFELMPQNISNIYLHYGDLPEVVNKIILPQVLSVSRMKGSSYQAQDFIMGDARENFQIDLQKELFKVLNDKSIIVHNTIIRNVEIPENILNPIRSVSIAKEQNLTNISMQDSAKKLAELNIELELIKQRSKEVAQDTVKIVAQINAERDQGIAELHAQTNLIVAELDLEKSEIVAKTNRLLGETEAQADFMLANAKAEGALLQAKELGEAGLLSDMKLIESLNPKIESRVIYAGAGTLWTDLKSATLPLPAK